MLPSFRLHREALKGLIDPGVRDHPETWYMRDDGSNLEENLIDMTEIVLATGLDFVEECHDPWRVYALIGAGTLLVPTSPRARELQQAIEDYMATDTASTSDF